MWILLTANSGYNVMALNTASPKNYWMRVYPKNILPLPLNHLTFDSILAWQWLEVFIVHFDKIPKYNAMNILNGYGQIGIYSPLEVSSYVAKTAWLETAKAKQKTIPEPHYKPMIYQVA